MYLLWILIRHTYTIENKGLKIENRRLLLVGFGLTNKCLGFNNYDLGFIN